MEDARLPDEIAALLGSADAIEALIGLDPVLQRQALAQLSAGALMALAGLWMIRAHPGQVPPAGRWRTWLIMAGRGFGKTRAGAEWVLQQVRDHPGGHIALVGATLEDARRVMVEGPSGLLACARTGEIEAWLPSRGEIRFAGGGSAQLYSAAAPERLRGPEHSAAWCDEIGKWGRRGPDAWDNLQMTMRAAGDARVIATTTPRPTELMRIVRAMAAGDGALTEGRTADNPHLPESFIAAMLARYDGTRTGAQELDGVLFDDAEGALWDGAAVREAEARGAADPGPLRRVVVAVDPPASAHGDACGIIACGIDRHGTAQVLEDASLAGAAPERWAAAVAACAARWGAARVVAEGNQGGDMVKAVLTAADARLPVRIVHARDGKSARADPVATLYARGKVAHRGPFPHLEAQLRGMIRGGGYQGPGRSPDRADALVWALTELMVRPPPAVPRIRSG